MFQRLYDILTVLLGESKQGSYSSDISQYQFNCIRCADRNGGPDGKYNLEVNFQEKLFQGGGVFHCWKCASEGDGMSGTVLKLLKMYATPSIYADYVEALSEIRGLMMYDINLFSGMTEDVSLSDIVLPNGFKKIDIKSCDNSKVLSYLEKRRITQDIIDRYNIGYTDWTERDYQWRNRIIVPSYNAFGDLNYYVGRDYTGKSKMKYRNCNTDKKCVIYQESLINWDAPIILVEGVFDALYKPNTISMLGKVLTKDTLLYQTLMKKSNAGVIICLDADTTIEETKRIFRILNTGKLKGKIKYIRLTDCKDFGDVYEKDGKHGIINAIRTAKVFEEIDLLFE